MQYLLLICVGGEPAPGPEDAEQAGDIDVWLETTGKRRLLGSELGPASAATTVRRRSGEVLLTDGPYAETKEQIVGFDLIECENLDEAIEIAAAHPVAAAGMVEVRPLVPED
jgi:hypothetical protein